ncbi:hypothetical protein BHM03_00054364 [Ensete ventricosum]|uniref:Uncharacterized protein n=1 Tax=Ensete ventricosum TaxID=4639 RepID=A0A445MM46_ENSVE|nr:hypothetical protein BHM03_00054364 [Ensete ventricosum]
MLSQKNTMVINFARSRTRVKFRSVFCAPSRKFKILAIHDVLALGKSYEHGFTKNNTTVINFTQSRVSIGFSCTVSEIQNTGLSHLISPWDSMSRVPIGFSCTVLEIQNTSHSQCISP